MSIAAHVSLGFAAVIDTSFFFKKMTALLFSSFALAIAFCAPPGVVTAEAVRRGLARGYGPALLIGFGSLVGDAVWAIIALAGMAMLVQNLSARLFLGLLGSLFLLFLAWTALRDAKRGGELPVKQVAARNDFVTGALLSISNPFAIAFWLGVGTSTITASVPDPQRIHYIAFLLAFLAGGFTWSFFLAGLITWGRQFVTPLFFRWVNLLCGLWMAYFGLHLFWSTFLQP